MKMHTRGTSTAVAGGILGVWLYTTADLNKILAHVGLEDGRENYVRRLLGPVYGRHPHLAAAGRLKVALFGALLPTTAVGKHVDNAGFDGSRLRIALPAVS